MTKYIIDDKQIDELEALLDGSGISDSTFFSISNILMGLKIYSEKE